MYTYIHVNICIHYTHVHIHKQMKRVGMSDRRCIIQAKLCKGNKEIEKFQGCRYKIGFEIFGGIRSCKALLSNRESH